MAGTGESMKESRENLGTRRILRKALEREARAYRSYLETAQNASDVHVKYLFQQLANDQLGHIEIIQAQLAVLDNPDAGAPPLLSSETPAGGNALACEREFEGVKRAVRVLAEARQEIETLQESREELYSMVTHDLRSPLVSLVSLSKRLMMSCRNRVTEREYEKLRWIWNESRRLEEFVNNMLALTQFRSDTFSLKTKALDPHALAQEVIESVEPQVRDQEQYVDLELWGMPPVQVDEWAFKRLMMNLVSNAVRYGRPGGRIRIGGRQQGEEILFWVKDQGSGISSKDLPHVFDKFYTDATARRGSGLGLAIARQAVEAHGGQIWVESEEGKGATFYFTLPRACQDEGTAR